MGLERDYTADGAVRFESWRCWVWLDHRNRWHRVDGPAAIYDSGRQEWYLNGQHHRLDEPAVIDDTGREEWYLNGQHHRLDGPAVTHADGSTWWVVQGRDITTEVKSWMWDNNIILPFTTEQQAEFVLRWG